MKRTSQKIIKAHITKKGLKIATLAPEIGITRQHLGAVLNGQYPAGKATAQKIIQWAEKEGLKVSALDLMWL